MATLHGREEGRIALGTVLSLLKESPSYLQLITRKLNLFRSRARHLAQTMGGVPSIPRDKSQSLRVIGAGYSRTGTVTMQLALEKLLDGPVMHGGTHIFSREDGSSMYPTRSNSSVLT